MTAASYDEFVPTIIAYLNENAGQHRRARYHVDVEREPSQLEASAFRGRLESEDETAIEDDLDFVGDLTLDGALPRLVAATNQVDPVATLDFTFERNGSDWKHTGFIHSLSYRKALDADRAELDERLRATLLDLAREGWSTVRLDYAWDEPLRVTCMVGPTPEKILPPETVDTLIDEYRHFFIGRGAELQTMTAVVRAVERKHLDLDLYYGVPHQSKDTGRST